MKTIAICDDEPQVLTQLNRYIYEYAQSRQLSLTVREFASAQQLLRTDTSFDLLILDIQMPGINGMEAAKKLRALGNDCPIIFLTALKEYVFDAFEVDAVNYLLKPIHKEKLFQSMDKVRKDNAGELIIKQGYDYRRIRLVDILYIEAMGRKVAIHLQNETLEYYHTLKELPAILGGNFSSPHRSYLINLEHVQAIDGSDIVLSNNQRIPIAKGRKEAFALELLEFFKRDSL